MSNRGHSLIEIPADTSLLDANPDGIVLLRTDGSFCYGNPAALHLLGLPAWERMNPWYYEGMLLAIDASNPNPMKVAEIDIPQESGDDRVLGVSCANVVFEGRIAHLLTLRDVTFYRDQLLGRRGPASGLEADFPSVYANLTALLQHRVEGQRVRSRLRIFRSFLEHGSFRKVSAEQIRQSGLSDRPDHSGPASRIRALGDDLGCQLTRRSTAPGRPLAELTACGKSLAEWLALHPELLDDHC